MRVVKKRGNSAPVHAPAAAMDAAWLHPEQPVDMREKAEVRAKLRALIG